MSPARRIAIALIRNDQRIHDNLSLYLPLQSKNVTHLLPLYVFDETTFDLSGLPGIGKVAPARTRLCGFPRTGPFRAKFILQSVYDLRSRLQQRSSDLLVRFGSVDTVTSSIVAALKANGDEVTAVYLQEEHCSEELALQRRLKRALEKQGVKLETHDTLPMIEPSKLPFEVPAKIPDVYTPFRKKVEASGLLDKMEIAELPAMFNKPFPYPLPPSIAAGDPTSKKDVFVLPKEEVPFEEMLAYFLKPLEIESDFYATDLKGLLERANDKTAFPFPGGETAALQRVEEYFFTAAEKGKPPPVATYKQTRNSLVGSAYSTKLSPFLCIGNVSPRYVIKALQEHEARFGQSQDTYWVSFEMLWREFFLLISRKYGTRLFLLEGFEGKTDPKQAKEKTQPGWWKSWEDGTTPNKDGGIDRWMKGTTGVPFIDANMRELRESGFMSNRGRQNVASFLTKDLGYDWRVGAEFFESHLVDYEPCANYSNWQYVAGCGNDPRASRQFNPIKQGNDYDPRGVFIKHWIPELEDVPSHRIQAPWLLTEDEQSRFGVKTPPIQPLIEQPSWRSHYNKKPSHVPKAGVANPNERVRDKKLPPGAGKASKQ